MKYLLLLLREVFTLEYRINDLLDRPGSAERPRCLQGWPEEFGVRRHEMLSHSEACPTQAREQDSSRMVKSRRCSGEKSCSMSRLSALPKWDLRPNVR